MGTSKTLTIEDRLSALEAKVGMKKTTRIAVVQDKSSSMGARQEATISGYNEYVEDLKKDDSDEAFLTLIQFDTVYRVVENGVNVKDAITLDRDSYFPNGMTALFDAVGRAINELKRDLKKDERALVVIMTDGQENSSREFTSDQISKMIKDCENEGNWTFVFLGAGQDSWISGNLLGLNRQQTVLYGEDAFSHGSAYTGLSTATSCLRGSEGSRGPVGAIASEFMLDKGASVKKEGVDGQSES